MKEFYGIILADSTEIILRVYEVDQKKWQLLHSTSRSLTASKQEGLTAYELAEMIAEFFSNTYTQKVIEWKIGARKLSKEIISEIALATGLRIECLDRAREQELLCKGMFTELW